MLPKPFYCKGCQDYFNGIRKQKRNYTPGKGSAKANGPGVASIDD